MKWDSLNPFSFCVSSTQLVLKYLINLENISFTILLFYTGKICLFARRFFFLTSLEATETKILCIIHRYSEHSSLKHNLLFICEHYNSKFLKRLLFILRIMQQNLQKYNLRYNNRRHITRACDYFKKILEMDKCINHISIM